MSYQMHPDELEEIEYQLNARHDYLSEAFGAEARMLDAQADDDAAFWEMEAAKDEAAAKGITVEALLEARVQAEAARLEALKCKACKDRIALFLDPCPF